MNNADFLYNNRKKKFFRRGIAFAVTSGICYGLYTAFLTLAETQGVWNDWFSGNTWGNNNPALNPFFVTFVLAALAAGINDLFSGICSLAVCTKNHQLKDLWQTVKTKPGKIMILCAAIGGPLATIAYIIGLNSASAAGNPGVIVPIAALNCAIGTILGKFFFKQKIQTHKAIGIVICICAAALIGGTSFANIGPEALLGCLFAFLAAFGWGFEGCVAGFGTTLIDYRIGIAIRQTSAGLLELLVAFPILAAFGGGIGYVPEIINEVITSPFLFIFLISGFFAMPAFSFWYKGNSMCGTALGMACNGMYAFWGPFFIWLIMGVFNLGGLSDAYPPLSFIQWIGALIMVLGIFCIAINPKKALEKKTKQITTHHKVEYARPSVPLYYAIIDCFFKGEANDAKSVISKLKPRYGNNLLLEEKEVEEALATACENEILKESGYFLDDEGLLKINYQITDFGKDLFEKYVGETAQ